MARLPENPRPEDIVDVWKDDDGWQVTCNVCTNFVYENGRYQDIAIRYKFSHLEKDHSDLYTSVPLRYTTYEDDDS